MHNSDPTQQHLENRNILLLIKCVLTALHVYCMILFDKGLWLKQEENVHLSERVVIQYRERDVHAGKNVKVYFKWGWNKSPFDINSVVFHVDDFNYGRRITTIFLLIIASQLGVLFSEPIIKWKIYITQLEQFQHRTIVVICQFDITKHWKCYLCS